MLKGAANEHERKGVSGLGADCVTDTHSVGQKAHTRLDVFTCVMDTHSVGQKAHTEGVAT